MIFLLSLNHKKWLHVAFQSESQAPNMAYWILCCLIPPYTSVISHVSLIFYSAAAAWSCPTGLRWWHGDYEYFVVV